MKTGIQVSSLKPLLTDEQQVRRTFERLAGICSLVQLQWIDPKVTPDCIARLAHETGLCSVSVQDYFIRVRENLDYYTQLNERTGGTWLCVSRVPEEMHSREGMAACVRELRALETKLEKKHQKLCFHPVHTDYEACEGIVPVDYLLENMPELQLCLDLYHLNRSGRRMADWMDAHPGRICMVHFKDEKDGQLVPSGQGDTDWSGVVPACRRAGVEYAFVEQETWSRDPFDCLGEALSWLNQQNMQESSAR